LKLNFTRVLIALALIFFGNSLAFGQTPSQISDLVKAVKFDDANGVKSLLNQGFNPNLVDANGNPLLVLAIKDKSYGVIEVLLATKGMDVDLSNNQGETPLMYAAINGDLPLVKTLVLKHKAQLDHISWTPLHYACSKGNYEVAQFLLSKGALVDSMSLGGTTPLMMAVQSGNEYTVKLLLNYGANLQIRNQVGLSAIDIADIYNQPIIGEGLRSRWTKLYKQSYPGPLNTATPKSS
jgi:ankyrin repeat protein